MWVAKSLDELREHRFRTPGAIGFVPTMGALHEGHLSLLSTAARHADAVIVSIYVNPTQFGPDEDFEQYPRATDEDLQRCREAGAAGVFVPPDEQMYPVGQPRCTIDVPELTADLEGSQRPGHFQGVCQVVARLLNMVAAHVAVFGQKDYQQLKVIEAMVRDLVMPCRIVASPTVREPDGLAMSSRNVYLSADERRRALGLYKALQEASKLIEEDGETDPQCVEEAMHRTITAHHMTCDYAAIRHPQTLRPLDCIEPELSGGVVALVAGRLRTIRLLDNRIIAAEH